MKLRTFNAPDMPAAMKLVREALGDDAVILSSKQVINGKRYISVTAAVERAHDTAPSEYQFEQKTLASSDNLEPLRHELRNILRFHNLPEVFIAKMLQRLGDEELQRITALHRASHTKEDRQLSRLILERLLTQLITFRPIAADAKPSRTLLLGAPGIGKTLTIAKLASARVMKDVPTVVITTDTKRAGGVEQLKAFTDILGLELKVADSIAALKKTLTSLPIFAHVLIDTAGCNPYNQQHLAELRAFCSLENTKPVLVMQAGGDCLEALDMMEQFTTLPLTSLLITHGDSTRRFGNVLASALAGKLEICNISLSSSVIEPPEAADSALMAELLLRYQQPS